MPIEIKRLTGMGTVAIVCAVLICLLALTRNQADAAESSVALPDPAVDDPLAVKSSQETAVLAGGCYWGIQLVFQHVKGVKRATSGYAGGHVPSPDYEQVGSGTTGHAESVKITYDSSKISYGQLLKVFFSVAHDPTQLNRQGPDVGTQYRSMVLYANDEQKHIAESYIAQLERARIFPRPIVTQVVPLKAFYEAEMFQQNYAMLHPESPYIAINDLPKLDHLREQLPGLYRK